ncbi:MAG: hypothetical protein DLM58_06775 [Pseudonocardiales bacterium]|nr:MAG: hypothetical protein DLM58_06775 [Pseudonocardiales bacterium]
MEGDATALPSIECDAVTMSANVAQFITDPNQWHASQLGIRNVLAPSGHAIFETSNPAARGWAHWTREQTFERITLPTGESAERYSEVKDVSWPLVQFAWTFTFGSDDATVTSTSTLRFRERDEVEADLLRVGLQVVEVGDAPDRPGRRIRLRRSSTLLTSLAAQRGGLAASRASPHAQHAQHALDPAATLRRLIDSLSDANPSTQPDASADCTRQFPHSCSSNGWPDAASHWPTSPISTRHVTSRST